MTLVDRIENTFSSMAPSATRMTVGTRSVLMSETMPPIASENTRIIVFIQFGPPDSLGYSPRKMVP